MPNVRFRGQSGHALVRCTCLLLTQSGHERRARRIFKVPFVAFLRLRVGFGRRTGFAKNKEELCANLIMAPVSVVSKFSDAISTLLRARPQSTANAASGRR